MSTPQPPRRRRIAGESKPGAPAKKSPTRKAASRRPSRPATEARATSAPAPAKKTTPKKSTVKQAAATSAPAKTAPVKTAPAKAAPTRTPPSSPAAAPAASTTETGKRRFGMSGFRLSGRLGALVALTVAALAFGLYFGVKGISDWRGDDGVASAHAKAASTAAASAETIFSYRYDKLDEHLEEATDTMTPSFGKKFETISPALNDLAPQRKIQVRASTREAAALECGSKCSEDEARVLVFIDQARLADGSTDPTVFGNRIELQMVNRDGTWLVNNIKAL